MIIDTPGPGCYRLPSDFGYYESKHTSKKIKKIKRRKKSAGSAKQEL